MSDDEGGAVADAGIAIDSNPDRQGSFRSEMGHPRLQKHRVYVSNN